VLSAANQQQNPAKVAMPTDLDSTARALVGEAQPALKSLPDEIRSAIRTYGNQRAVGSITGHRSGICDTNVAIIGSSSQRKDSPPRGRSQPDFSIRSWLDGDARKHFTAKAGFR
jgi:hypothetical protein